MSSLCALQYSRESSDYIYGPGDIGGGNPIVFPDQEDVEEEEEHELKIVDQGATTRPAEFRLRELSMATAENHAT